MNGEELEPADKWAVGTFGAAELGDLRRTDRLVKMAAAIAENPSASLLRQDDEMLSHLPPGKEPPEPVLYDPELHKRHRTGHYHPIRKEQATNRMVQIEPPGSSSILRA